VKKIFVAFIILAAIGCARVQHRVSEPIKVDINMRVDVYQHVVEDARSIEDRIYNEEEGDSYLIFASGFAYAAEISSVELDAAIRRRKERVVKITEYLNRGYIGENREAHLEMVVRGLPSELNKKIKRALKEENRDREIIHRATAKKRGVDVSEVRKVFFEEHYKRAPAGSWFEVYNESQGKYVWKRK